MAKTAQEQWEAYRDQELAWIRPFLTEKGYHLDERQPHIGGERYLMQAVTTMSGRKLILLATHTSGMRVVVKATSDPQGIREISHERLCRSRLSSIHFAYGTFHTPREVLYHQQAGKAVAIQEYIEQEKPFLERSTPEQFTLALAAFKTQEGAHAATYEHMRSIRKTFGIMRTHDYLERFAAFETEVGSSILSRAKSELASHEDLIELYGGFLTHTDFVPHNIRIVGSDIYLLDASSLRFGNKYEGLARFINFMELYNSELARAFLTYLSDNRTPEESESLRLMRIYRLGEIIAYYTRTIPKSEGDLRTLNEERVQFWSEVLTAVLARSTLSPSIREAYSARRDSLRSAEENVRQQGLH